MKQKVRKAVILVAGFGTRFLPATKAIPKEMLPIYDAPALQYVVEELVQAGITEIVFVTGRSKRAIEDHFDANAELEIALLQSRKHETLKKVRRATSLAHFIYVRQPQPPRGTGDATLAAQPVVGNEPFFLLYPDELLFGKENSFKQMLSAYEEYQAPIVAVYRVPRRDVQRYGIIDNRHIRGRIHEVSRIIEKPTVQSAPSTLAVTRGFILTPAIFPLLTKIRQHKGEYYLTDAIELYNKKRSVFAAELQGDRFDVGSKLGWLQANVYVSLRHKDVRKPYLHFIRQQLKSL